MNTRCRCSFQALISLGRAGLSGGALQSTPGGFSAAQDNSNGHEGVLQDTRGNQACEHLKQ